MGWWGYEVMSGDTPLDMVYDIDHTTCGIDVDQMFYEPENINLQEIYTANIKALAKLAKKGKGWNKGELDILQQVVAHVMMANGVPRNKHMNKILDLARDAALRDDWATTEPKRSRAMDAFVNAIDAYTGTAVELPDESLFDKMYGG